MRRATRVYFVQAGYEGPIKIGFSSDPAARLRALQVSSAVPLRLLATMTGGRREEYELHDRFQRHRLEGEWFEPAAPILEYVARLLALRGP